LFLFLFWISLIHCVVFQMGACLEKLGVGGAPENPISPELLSKIADKLVDILTDLPDTFMHEREQVLWDMWVAMVKNEEYKHEVFGDVLTYKEYPDNEMKVCALALKIACADELKDLLCEIIHDMVDDEIDEKLNAVAAPLRPPARKLADKAIEKAVDQAVDKALSTLREKLEKGEISLPEVKPKEGEDKPKGENPGKAKMSKHGTGKSKSKKKE